MQTMLERGGVRAPSLWTEWFRALTSVRVGEIDRTQSLLVLRFTLLNMVGAALAVAAWLQGWTAPLFEGAAAWMVPVIIVTFLVGLVWCARLLFDTGGELDQVKGGHVRPGSRASRFLNALQGAGSGRREALQQALKVKLQGRIAGVRHIAGSLVFLGLIGTVVGFMIALSGVDPSRAGDPSAVAPMVATLIDGMGLALSTTLTGAILNLWLMANFRMLEHGTAKLYAELLERRVANDDDT